MSEWDVDEAEVAVRVLSGYSVWFSSLYISESDKWVVIEDGAFLSIAGVQIPPGVYRFGEVMELVG